jgi:integrase
MAAPTVNFREASDGGYFEIRYRRPDGKSRRAGRFHVHVYGGKRAAKAAADEAAALITQSLAGVFVDTKASETLGAFAEAWFAAGPRRMKGKIPLAEGSVWRLRSTYDRYVAPVLGPKPLNKITPNDCARCLLLAEDRTNNSPYVSRNVHRILHRLFRDARKQGIIIINPADDPDHPPMPRVKTIVASPEQVAAIVERMPEAWHAWILLGAGTGMRMEEVSGLRAHRIDWALRQIRVEGPDCTCTSVNGRMIDGPAKTESSNRVVPVPEEIMNVLAWHIETFGLGEGDRVFHDRKGGPISRATLYRNWYKTVAEVLPGFKPGQLRHTFASLYAMGEYDLGALMKILGHRRITTTQGYIRQLHPEQYEEVATKIGRAFAGLIPSRRRLNAVR